jgi:lipoate-protein ligase A
VLDPYYNLALEQKLLETVGEGQCILYLWQNENTVVIGRNQNPWKECRLPLLEQEGGRLARRLSGGGAVFHDLGNLNFTFLVSQKDYDLDKQLAVIQTAVESLGIPTEKSGRNDLMADGRKFSGNAFYKNGKQAYHHGTLLVNADMEKLSRYLSPSKAKLQAKGVDSVRSRVGNLKELNNEITIPRLKLALEAAFSQVYGREVERIHPEYVEESLIQHNQSRDWLYGQKHPFTMQCEGQFPWGGVQILLRVQNGMIQGAKVYTDAMDVMLATRLENALCGCELSQQALKGALSYLEFGEEITHTILR